MARWMTFLLACPLVLLASEATRAAAPAAPAPLAAGDPDALNVVWVLVCAFLVFFMQAGFALVETGLTRAKNVAHTMAMNVMVFSVGTVGFWACGFAFLSGHPDALGGAVAGGLTPEWSAHLFGKEFGVLGHSGFFLAGRQLDTSVLALFLFQLMFMDTAATIPTGALAERWKFLSFVLFALLMSTVIYPVYGNWVWGNGWLARLGANFGLGHGHVDFAGSTVVHMVGGLAALVGAFVVGPRLGKFRPDGRPNPLPAHNVPLYLLGSLFLVFGWFGFNAGSTLSATDPNIARIAVNTALSAAAGAFTAMCYMAAVYGKPDPSFLCNGLLAGLVAITASCAYVAPWAAVLIGGLAGVLVIWSVLFVEGVLNVDDPVGAISVHGTSGLWGALAVGLFADGTYAPHADFNGVAGPVRGLLYGDASQLVAQLIGVLVNVAWVVPTAYVFFRVVGRLVGNRVTAQAEFQGLDVPELGALGYITQDPKVPESRTILHHLPTPEPRAASVPPNGGKRFSLLVEGADMELLARTWSDLCQVGDRPPPPEFMVVYPYMTTMQGNRFRFRGGDAQAIRSSMERLLQQRLQGRPVRVRLDA